MTRAPGAIACLALALGVCGRALAEDARPSLPLPRISSPILVDGDLSDPAWQEAARIETFYETNVGDNVPPPVHTVARIGYDSRFLYASFECDDPDPSRIRAPYVDRDNVFSEQDFVGVILDPKNDRRSAIEFFVNPRGIQDDGVTNDATGTEDFSPDFFWESAARIGPRGYTVEVAIPLSSIRYPAADPQTWGLILYRNYPRDFRYQMFHVQVPRGGNCFICREMEVTGITKLPRSGHLVLAPYATATESGTSRDEAGRGLDNGPIRGDAGIDAKWTPNADTVVDATINPDFSQIESDTAQIGVNQRFALFFPEKRPFFLEGVDLLETPIVAVYTRTITSPRWGGRVTGKVGGSAYTLLVTEDRGGGSVILPGPQSSDLAPQELSSVATVGRLRSDFGRSFAGLLLTDRENEDGSSNRVFGPDFQWRPSENDQVTGQFLYSATRTPDRTDLAAEWDGRRMSTGGGFLSWLHTTRTWLWRTTYQDIGDAFRADLGFVPQVGFRQARNYLGYAFWPTGFFLSRIQPLFVVNDFFDRQNRTIERLVYPGVQFQGKASLLGQLELHFDSVRVGSRLLPRRQLVYRADFAPSQVVSAVSLKGFVGREIDFENARVGDGAERTEGHGAADETPRSAARRQSPLARRPGGERARGKALHRPGHAGEGDLHVHGTRVPAGHRPVRRDAPGTVALHVRGSAAGGRVPGVRSLLLQAQLAVRALRRLRRRSGSGGIGGARPVGTPVLPEGFVRLSALAGAGGLPHRAERARKEAAKAESPARRELSGAAGVFPCQ